MDATPQALVEPASGALADAPAAAPAPPRSAAQAEVLQAAARSFMERGFAAASIDDVARRMGATKGRVYHYYRAKLDLFVDVVRHGLEIIHRDVTAARVAAPDPATRMAAMVRAHLRSILLEQPFHRAALQGVELHLTAATTPDQREALAGVIALRDRHQREFESALDEGVEAGVFAPCDVKLRARTLLAALNGPVAWYRPRPNETDGDRDRLIDDIAGFALAGLARQTLPETLKNPKGRKS
ncbi:MAG: TetR/AcrR family transcriptional regulator [Pseudomonadota bacterium]